MKATIVTMTKELARDYLTRNNQNRKVKKATLLFYKQQMISGKWKENGEPIIIDVNGVIKDGQHRLLAVVESDFSYKVPVISGVESNVMDTIDTGKNRSASDVLHLEGFKYSALIASSVKAILYEKLSEINSHSINISNSSIFEYANKYKNYLYELVHEAQEISSLQVARVLTDTMIVFYLHKYGINQDTITFLNSLTGTTRKPKSATDYVYKKLFKCYTGEERLSLGDKQKYIERAYEYFIKGNPQVKSIKIKYNKQKLNK